MQVQITLNDQKNTQEAALFQAFRAVDAFQTPGNQFTGTVSFDTVRRTFGVYLSLLGEFGEAGLPPGVTVSNLRLIGDLEIAMLALELEVTCPKVS